MKRERFDENITVTACYLNVESCLPATYCVIPVKRPVADWCRTGGLYQVSGYRVENDAVHAHTCIHTHIHTQTIYRGTFRLGQRAHSRALVFPG